METEDIIQELALLEKKVLAWQPAVEKTEQVVDKEKTTVDFTKIQDQLDFLLKTLQQKPKEVKDAVSPHLVKFQNSVQGYYDEMVRDVNDLRDQIDTMQTHSKAMWAYGAQAKKVSK